MSGEGFSLRAVGKSYGRQTVLDHVSLLLPAGRHSALVGPSGCGKSTLLRLLAGLDAPDAGEILLNGTPASAPGRISLAPHARGIGMVFQDLALWPNLSVFDNVRLGRRGSTEAARDALKRCGIEPLAGSLPGELSGGQQQRVALARAIAARPAFLFLDEPFAGLDWTTKAVLLDEIHALAEEQGFTVLLVSHDPAEVSALADYLIVLEDARIAEQGATAAVFSNPRTATARLMRAYAKSN